MDSEYPVPTTTRPIVYVREVKAASLPEEVRAQLPGVSRLYAIHHEEGEQLALVTDRTMAFVMARQNDYDPVSVH